MSDVLGYQQGNFKDCISKATAQIETSKAYTNYTVAYVAQQLLIALKNKTTNGKH
jgi:hypothetical protein